MPEFPSFVSSSDLYLPAGQPPYWWITDPTQARFVPVSPWRFNPDVWDSASKPNQKVVKLYDAWYVAWTLFDQWRHDFSYAIQHLLSMRPQPPDNFFPQFNSGFEAGLSACQVYVDGYDGRMFLNTFIEPTAFYDWRSLIAWHLNSFHLLRQDKERRRLVDSAYRRIPLKTA